MCNETVYQPESYAQDVGVPLQPTPTIGSFDACSHPIQSNNIHAVCHSCISPCFHGNAMPSRNVTCESMGCPYGSNCSYHTDSIPTNSSYQCNVHNPKFSYIQHQQQSPLASVYTNQVTLSQIEQYKAQLNSDVDYVIYPLRDPAISKQEYMDAKQSQVIAQQIHKQSQLQIQGGQHMYNVHSSGNTQQVPPYRSPKLSPLYRSTPNVTGGGSVLSSYPSYQSLESHNSMHQPGSSSGYSSMARGRYFSQQSLASSLSSTQSGYSASTHSLSGSYDTYGSYASEPVMTTAPPSVMRVRSDESILSSAFDDSEVLSVQSGPPHTKPPPPYRAKVTMQNKYVQERRA